jgi:hypothetical protein
MLAQREARANAKVIEVIFAPRRRLGRARARRDATGP